jgi:hypothetical protein
MVSKGHPFESCEGYRKRESQKNMVQFPPAKEIAFFLENWALQRILFIGGHTIDEKIFIFDHYNDLTSYESNSNLDYKLSGAFDPTSVEQKLYLENTSKNVNNIQECSNLCANFRSEQNVCLGFTFCRTGSVGRFECLLTDQSQLILSHSNDSDSTGNADDLSEPTVDKCFHYEMQYEHRYHLLKRVEAPRSDLISKSSQLMTAEQCVRTCQQAQKGEQQCKQVQLCADKSLQTQSN